MSNRGKLLLMVDDPKLKASLTQSLAKSHYQISSAESDFVKKVFDEVPHLILIDENCGKGGQGAKIALAIKNDVVLRYIPIVFLAADSNHIAAYRARGIDFVIPRDIQTQELLLHVRKALSQNYNELDLNPLTHLPGARSSVLRMERAIHSKKKFAVCCVDLSELAAFNSVYGDARGDQVIIRLAEIIQTILNGQGSSEDFLGHLGGDDFVIVTESSAAEKLSEAVIKYFDEAIPNFYDAHDRKQGYILHRNKDGVLTRYPVMSLLIAIVHNDHGYLDEISDVSRIAGELKRYMKAMQGSCYMKDRRRSPRVTVEVGDSAAPETHFPGKMKSVKISSAPKNTEEYAGVFNAVLKGRKLMTNYQPIVDLKTKKIVGYEALTAALVEHPLKDAALFFETARELGKTKELDVLCVEMALKNGQGLESDRKMFLNLNHETLIDTKIMKTIFAAKGTIGFKNLVIEVTEQSILRSFGKVRDALLELKEQGVSVAIDDVGGGAVSLRDVAVLRPDYMKYDRSLIRQIDSSPTKQQIVLSLIVFANGIQATTTAEGVETQEEYEAVLDCGIHLGQGYYFARPGRAFPEVS